MSSTAGILHQGLLLFGAETKIWKAMRKNFSPYLSTTRNAGCGNGRSGSCRPRAAQAIQGRSLQVSFPIPTLQVWFESQPSPGWLSGLTTN